MCCSNGNLVLRSRIQHVVHDHGLKEQDFTETFLRRAHGFSITDDNQNKWFKATAWRFTNLAYVVGEREKAKDRKYTGTGNEAHEERLEYGTNMAEIVADNMAATFAAMCT